MSTPTKTMGSHRTEQIREEYAHMWGLLGHEGALRRLADAYHTATESIEYALKEKA